MEGLVLAFRDEEAQRPIVQLREAIQLENVEATLAGLALGYKRLGAAEGPCDLGLGQGGFETSRPQALQELLVASRMDRAHAPGFVSEAKT